MSTNSVAFLVLFVRVPKDGAGSDVVGSRVAKRWTDSETKDKGTASISTCSLFSYMSSKLTPNSPFQPTCLQGRVALLTGGGSGIGFEIARQLPHHGCRAVVLCGRRANFLQKACTILQAESPASVVAYQVCDVRKPESCQMAVQYCREQFGALDILVNGAAGNFLAKAADLKPKGFATVLEIDTMGTFNMSYAAYPLLKQSRVGAVVINISATLQCPGKSCSCLCAPWVISEIFSDNMMI